MPKGGGVLSLPSLSLKLRDQCIKSLGLISNPLGYVRLSLGFDNSN